MNCILCQQKIKTLFSLMELLLFKSIDPPLICLDCQKQFSRIGEEVCNGCGRQMDTIGTCEECERWQRINGYLLENKALFHYDEPMKKFIKQYKFNGDYRLRKVFKAEIEKKVSELDPDIIVPIPVNPGTLAIRGFNQVTGLINELKYEEILVTKELKKSEPQSHKTRQERIRMQQPFELNPGSLYNLKDKSVLLLDDVYTTGTTLYHAGNLIRQCNPSKITSVTLAR